MPLTAAACHRLADVADVACAPGRAWLAKSVPHCFFHAQNELAKRSLWKGSKEVFGKAGARYLSARFITIRSKRGKTPKRHSPKIQPTASSETAAFLRRIASDLQLPATV